MPPSWLTCPGLRTVGSAHVAQGTLVVYCWRERGLVPRRRDGVRARDGIRSPMTRKSSGEVYARSRPRRRIRAPTLVGRTGDPHHAGGRRRTDDRIQIGEARRVAGWPFGSGSIQGRTVGIYPATRFGFKPILSEEGYRRAEGAGPICSSQAQDEVQVADPNSSGTSYTLLATVVQLMGETRGSRISRHCTRTSSYTSRAGAASPPHWARPRSGSRSSTTSCRCGRQGPYQGSRSVRR